MLLLNVLLTHWLQQHNFVLHTTTYKHMVLSDRNIDVMYIE